VDLVLGSVVWGRSQRLLRPPSSGSGNCSRAATLSIDSGWWSRKMRGAPPA